MKVWFIHGAQCSSRSFVWLKEQLPQYEAVDIDYSTEVSVSTTVRELVEQANAETEPFDIIGHSLGGLIAVAIAQKSPMVRRVVTMGSPFGGSQVAVFLRFFKPNSLMDDIQPFSPFLLRLRNRAIKVPVLSLVTTGGQSSLIGGRNDGIVSVASQTAISGPEFIETSANHSEVLLSYETVDAITEFFSRPE